ncbi:alpha/beta hydrolase fold [Desulfoluna butyratoxydans]|uniref:Alpha/beta hydrolase fold n=1 Tax=Desulfoluna butyratoxydans TaxID=231438 RepID=A0A4U8YQX0_9BACT|nr:alpha/beta hydrolase fold [Desulfoluna butyratoxydans]
MRLVFFPYAGTGVEAFRGWDRFMPDNVELCSVNYPGRGKRLNEPVVTWVPDLIARMDRALAPFMDVPVVFFGHCMGGMLCFELTRALHGRGGPMPASLFLSGVRAPQCPSLYPDMHALADDEFVSVVKALGLRPDSLFEEDAVVKSTMAVLKGDFQLVETWETDAAGPGGLPVPIHVFGGRDDRFVPEPHLRAWDEHTSQDFSARLFPGGHFYLHDDRAGEALFSHICTALASL